MFRKTQGLTIIELLITAFIFVIMLTLIVGGLQTSGNAVDRVISENELLEDLRITGQLMADEISRAVYIYPEGSILQFGKSGWTTKKPNGSQIWQVGKDPILAFLAAPKDPLLEPGDCAFTKEACLQFIAFYALQRKDLVKNSSKDGEILQDSLNEEAWVLYEYRKHLPIGEINTNQPPPTDPNDSSDPDSWGLNGASGNFITDYVIPEGFIPFNSKTCIIEGEYNPTCSNLIVETNDDLHYLKSISSGEFQLTASMKTRSKTITTPTLSFPIAPKNLYTN